MALPQQNPESTTALCSNHAAFLSVRPFVSVSWSVCLLINSYISNIAAITIYSLYNKES